MELETLNKIDNQLRNVKEKYGNGYFNHHEAYAVLLEEVDELWDEIKKKEQDPKRIKEEIIDAIVVLIRWYECM